MARLKPFALCLAAVLAAPAAHADTPLGPPLRVDTPSLERSGRHPVVARAPDGGFTVIWESGDELLARRHGADGTPLAVPVTVGTLGGNRFAAVHDIAIDGNGKAVVVWRAIDAVSGQQTIRVRRYGTNGSALGGAIVVDSGGDASHFGAPAVAIDADGDFVIGWSHGSALSTRDLDIGIRAGGTRLSLGHREVRLRRYDRSGVALGTAETVARRPDLLLDSDLVGVPNVGQVVGARIDLGLIDTVDVGMDNDGDHVVVWGGNNFLAAYALASVRLPYPAPALNTDSILARRYDARGVALQKFPTRVDGAVAGQLVGGLLTGAANGAPQLAMQADGRYAITWRQRQWRLLGTREQVQLARFDADGGRQSADGLPALQLGRASFSPVAIAADGAGDYLLAWIDSEAIRAARLPASGAGGQQFEVLGPAQGFTAVPFDGLPTVAADAAGQPVFSFVAYDRDARTQGIYARLFGRP